MNHTITNPKGIDRAIQTIQTYLFDNLGWGDIDVYGRVFKNINKEGKLVAEAYKGNNEYIDVFTNDSKNGSVFFIESDVHNSKEGIRFSNSLKIVFMVNLKKVLPGIVHRADMEAEFKAIELLRKTHRFSFEKMGKGIKESLGEFYTEGIKTDDMQPYHVFSITGEVTYTVSCLTN